MAAASMVLAALALLAPALARGPYLGPYHLLTTTGLLHRPGSFGPGTGNSDLVTEMIPWSAMTWTQVHHLHLPLWNPSSGLGMPLAFNWQSAPFGLPALVGYLLPMRFAFTVGVVVTLVVAGTGTYVLARVLGLGIVASTAAGLLFELSGPFLGWLGYPLGAVMSWTGWLLAAGILVVRGRRPRRDVAFFAVVLALAVYAGNPESLAVLLLAAGLFLVTILATVARRAGVRALVRPVLWLAAGVAAGVALAAPLALPGFQLASGTTRTGLGGHNAIPLQYLGVILLPNDYRAFADPTLLALAAHVPSTIGFVAVPFALAAVARRWRRPEVLALVVLVVVFAALALSAPVETAADHLPFLGRVYWSRALMPLALGLSVLAGMGADALVTDERPERTLRWVLAGFAALAVWLLAAWLTGHPSSRPALAAARDRAFLWPAVDVAAGLAVVGTVLVVGRRRRAAAAPERTSGGAAARAPDAARRARAGIVVVLFGLQVVTLVVVGSSLWQSSPTFLPTNRAVAALQQTVGTRLVGFDAAGCVFGSTVLAVPQETNVAYGLHEGGIYDPIIPRSYFTAWPRLEGQAGGVPALASFCPSVTSAAGARRVGISFLLAPHGQLAPPGAVYSQTVGHGRTAEDLYRVPGAAPATLAVTSGAAGRPSAVGHPITVVQPNPSTWRMTTSAPAPAVLRLHVTDVPGWRATLDGRPLTLEPDSGLMLAARLPAGRHVVVVTYWPATFSLGLVLAAVAAVALAGTLLLDRRRRRAGPAADPGP